jgi:NADH-quinone oxidoreductase subunit N
MNTVLPKVEWSQMAPELILVGAALALLVAGTFFRQRAFGTGYAIFTLAATVAALVATWGLWDDVTGRGGRPRLALSGAIVVDGFGLFLTVVVCSSVFLGVLLSDGYLARERLTRPDFYVLMLLSASGGILMSKANDLILVFLEIGRASCRERV